MNGGLKLGTRGSPLALAQARKVAAALETAQRWPSDYVQIVPIRTGGDDIQDRPLAEIGGKGLWTKELDRALLSGEVDFCVHSMKDVESERPPEIHIAAMRPRGDFRERLIGAESLDALPHGARVGTSSPRRAAQLRARRPRFNEENSHKVMPYFGQEHLLAAQEKKSLREKKYRDALAKNLRLSRKEGIDAAMRNHRVDALVVPSGGPAWLIDMVNGDSTNWDMESTSPPAVAGYPHITVPAGYIFGLPVGVSFIGQAWQEPELIKFAYAFEQATQFRRQPRFLPTAHLNA